MAWMNFGIAEAKRRFPELIRAAEQGQRVVITRNSKPVAQILAAPAERRQVRLGGMKGRIRFLPGWDVPVDSDRLLAGEL